MRDALAEIDVAYPGLLLRFGGHAMAAGMSLRRADIDKFAAAFDVVARTRIPAEQLDAVLLTDGELGSDDFSIDLAQRLRDAGPWGQTFPEPLFDGVFDVASWQVMAETHLRLKLRCDGFEQPLGAVMFNGYRGSPVPARIRAASSAHRRRLERSRIVALAAAAYRTSLIAQQRIRTREFAKIHVFHIFCQP